jgi:uncharacterized protein (DUF924 family)
VSDWRRDLLTFWFGLDPKQWWKGSPELDEECRHLFLQTWAAERELPVESFLDDSLTALAAVILFDQMPRNMFRGSAEQFATDHIALAIAKEAVRLGYDDRLSHYERCFLYMPFEHSENLADQKRSLQLLTALGDDYLLGYAKKHHDIIERFGRFPHRNQMLGRAPRPEEIAASDVYPW